MAKLTLSVDDQAIKMAKNWAKIQGLSVTRSKQAPRTSSNQGGKSHASGRPF